MPLDESDYQCLDRIACCLKAIAIILRADADNRGSLKSEELDQLRDLID